MTQQQQREFTFGDLKDILVNRIGLQASQVTEDPNTSFGDLGMDSLAMVELQLAVKQRYGFDIPDEDTGRIRTIGEAIAYVNQRLQGRD